MQELFLRENINTILDYLEEGVQIIDHNGVIVYNNSFAQKIDGIERDNVEGRYLLEVYPSLTVDSSTLLNVIRHGEPIYNKEQTFINYKGEKITTLNTSIPIKARGRIVGAMEISRDITTVKKMSEKIVDLQSRLYTVAEEGVEAEERTAKYSFDDIIGRNKDMIKLQSLAIKAAETDVSVMIGGDTGTGKELFVQAIHNHSRRKDRPFIAQNCAALPANLLEGILFGTAKGGFTGAEDRPGLFELANGGTLFLDEINSMPLELQSKLLRVLQDKRIRRVGSIDTIDVDVRIISAINVSPNHALEERQLRRDLFYRLNVVFLEIPSLKNRRDDIPILTNFFIDKFNKRFNKEVQGVDDQVMRLFMDYSWDGNVRELEHLLEGVISIIDKNTIGLEDLPMKFKSFKNKDMDLSLNGILEMKEKELIRTALLESEGNITRAAEILKIPRQTLQYRMKKLGI